MSKIKAAAPPCITWFKLLYSAEMGRLKSAVASGEEEGDEVAEMSVRFVIRCRSMPAKEVEAAILWYLAVLVCER